MASKQSGTAGTQGFEEGDFRGQALDLLRTSQKMVPAGPRVCSFGAPWMAIVKNGVLTIGQGCCKSWYCPRCSVIYAAYHQHRMIEGTKVLLETGPMYFWTITCIGKELDIETHDDNYMEWTNRLLSACRYQAKSRQSRWAYVQVTERQKRGAAHSHLLHSWVPRDSVFTENRQGFRDITSSWFRARCVSAGLGPQYKLSEVKSGIAAAAYVAKYLKKHLSDEVWPENWRRIRYSQEFPDTTEKPDFATVLLHNTDWEGLEAYMVKNGSTKAADNVTYEYARHHIIGVEKPVALS